MALITQVGAPVEFLASLTQKKSTAVIAALRSAIESSIDPLPLPEENIERFTVALPSDLHQRLMRKCEETRQSPVALSAQWIHAVMQRASTVPQTGLVEETPKQDGSSNKHDVFIEDVHRREEQELNLSFLREFLRPTALRAWYDMQEGKIALVEAPTGSGKGRMITSLAAALWRKKGGNAKIVISAPLPVTRQLLAELQLIAPEIPAMTLLGRANFIDTEKLSILDIEEEAPELAAWIKAGAPMLDESDKRFGNTKYAFLLEDAIRLAPNDSIAQAVSQCMLDEHSSGPAQDFFLKIRKESSEFNGILFVSHFYLMTDQRLHDLNVNRESSYTGILPERFDALLIDEAHLLEQAGAAVYSRTYHIHSLMTKHIPALDLKKREERRILDELGHLGKAIQQIVQHAGGDVLCRLSEYPELIEKFKAVKEALLTIPQPVRASKKTVKSAVRRYLKEFVNDIETIVEGKLSLQLGLTPAREYPVITIGRSNLYRPLKALWDRCDAAFLCSATIFLETALGKSSKYFQWVMALPELRTCAYEVSVPWLRSAAKVSIDPTSVLPNDKERADEWIDSLSNKIKKIYDEAKGGVVALCTSYETANRLETLLRPSLQDVLIVQSSVQNASTCSQIYRELAKSGKRPLWIGLGSAWTGIDLSDSSVPPEEDYLLTDLIVTRIPWRLNRSITHLRRMLGNRDVDRQETLRMFRQGIGRLVRREGVKDRRLHILDPRILDNRYVSFRKTLKVFE